MEGPYFLFRSIVTLMVKQNGAGNFRICEKNEKQQLLVRAVGHATTDLKAELFKHAGDRSYMYFYFDFTHDARQAYEKACLDYHEFRGTLSDKSHPRRPEGVSCPCPVKGCEY
ncbi:MAG TPA: hypothetical protein PLV42_04325 [bacterium]|nr:hypothetical protein [bacterium]